MTTTESTTIQISRETARYLDKTAAIMIRIFPDMWGTAGPPRNAVVGFLAGQFLNGITDAEIDQLAADWRKR
jgi:hypothetical protein